MPRSAPEQTEDPTTQLTELVGRLIVLGHVDVGHDARGSLGQDDHPAGQAQCLVDVVGDQDRSEALGLPQLDDLVLELEAGQCVELAQRLVQGRLTRARASEARWAMPPESVVG